MTKRIAWDGITNIHIIEVSEVKEKEKGVESLFEVIMGENFPKI